MLQLDLFSRRGCHLCEVMIEQLVPLIDGRLVLEVHDIDSRPDWAEKYALRIPVLEFEGRTLCQYHLDREAVGQVLAIHDRGTPD